MLETTVEVETRGAAPVAVCTANIDDIAVEFGQRAWCHATQGIAEGTTLREVSPGKVQPSGLITFPRLSRLSRWSTGEKTTHPIWSSRPSTQFETARSSQPR